MNWIDANKQVPEQGQQVLVLCKKPSHLSKLDNDWLKYTVATYCHQSEYAFELGWHVVENCSGWEYESEEIEPLFWCVIEEPTI